MNARERILRSVRDALGEARGTKVDVPRGYRRRLTAAEAATRADVIALFTERLADHRATVRHAGADDLATSVAAALWARGARRIVAPADLPFGWLAELDGVQAVADTGLTDLDTLAAVDGVVTGCAVAIAQTGTIVLDGGRAQGRRLLSLVPGYHLCVVHADQVVGTVPEAVARLRPERPLTWISAPSGPHALEVLVVED